MEWISQNQPVEAFDYNGNGRIDFNDLIFLTGTL
jgi:PKD repeat protein